MEKVGGDCLGGDFRPWPAPRWVPRGLPGDAHGDADTLTLPPITVLTHLSAPCCPQCPRSVLTTTGS